MGSVPADFTVGTDCEGGWGGGCGVCEDVSVYLDAKFGGKREEG